MNNCDECDMDTSDCHIYIMTSDEGDEMTLCEFCRHQFNWVGWLDDQELDDHLRNNDGLVAV